MRYMVLLFIIDVYSSFQMDGFESSIERVVKTGFRTKTDAKNWSNRLIAANYTEKVPKGRGYQGNRYKVDRVIINYNDSTSDNVELLSKIFC